MKIDAEKGETYLPKKQTYLGKKERLNVERNWKNREK